MKNTQNTLSKIAPFMLFICALSLLAFPVFAQGGPPATPIDGGLSLLLAAGGAYGVKKLRDRRNRQ